MKSVFSYLVFTLSVALFAEASKFRCDYDYFNSAGGWFKIHPTPRTWREASFVCNTEGAELASPSSDDENDSMMALIYDHQHIMAVHTAKHPVATYNSYSEESEALALTIHGTYLRVSQNDYYPFICYKDAKENVQLNECGTLDNEYALDNRTGHCYKLHRTHVSWYQARRVCEIEGGQLAIINSDEEAQVIREVFAKYPKGSDWNFDNIAFLGFSITDDGNVWKTLYGQTLKEAGYEFFSPGEPNNARGDEFCGSVGRNGLLFDDPCTRRMPFMCEKEMTSGCEVESATFSPRLSSTHRIFKKLKVSEQTNNEVF